MGGLAGSLGLGPHFLEEESGEEETRGSLEGLGAPGRARGGLGLGAPGLAGEAIGGVSQRPLLGGSWGRFSSLRNTARRIFG